MALALGVTMDAVRDMTYRDLAAIRRVLDRVQAARTPDAARKPPTTLVRPVRRPPQRPQRPQRPRRRR